MRVSSALLLAGLLAPLLPSGATGADVNLTVTRGPGTSVQLDWTPAGTVYGVYRSMDCSTVGQGKNLRGQTDATTWTDDPPESPMNFYLVKGPACQVDADCSSGHCVDGACCNTGCAGACEACDLHGQVGTCAALPGNPDPASDCARTCAVLPPLGEGTCEVIPGTSGRVLFVGNVLGFEERLVGGEVLVEDTGLIGCVGCGCAAIDPQATVVRCPAGVISPGLINALDLLSYSQNSPHVDTGERYEHRHEWRLGKNGHTKIPAPGASPDQVKWGELRQLMGGATSTAGSTAGQSGLQRNLNTAARQEGLAQEEVLTDNFPLGDSGGTMLETGCGYPSIRQESTIADRDAYHATVGEGISVYASNEFLCLSSSANGGQDLLQPQSSFRHMVGVTAADLGAAAADGTGLIWSPRSNISFYGDTARVTTAVRLGVTVALASDWVVSGSMNLLRELRCADAFDREYLDDFFGDRDLWRMVTARPAELTATDDVIGTIAPGTVADLAIFDGALSAGYRALIEADAADVVLVLRAGTALYGDAALVEGLRGGATDCDPIDVCGRAKTVCLASEIGMTLAQLQASVGTAYPLYYCDTPAGEPSCRPYRPRSVSGSTTYDGVPTPDDPDGDGLPTASDNCPAVFNPVRPMDGGLQPDADGDGAGDACDPCPLAVECPGL
jgi:hypothetical protein